MGRRTELREWMDDPGVDRRALASSLAFIRRVNRYLGGTRAVMGYLARWARADGWERQGEVIRILDVATGSADIPLAILEWARRRGIGMRVIGLDAHATTLELAREYVGRAWRHAEKPGLELIRGDALALPLADGSVDYAISSMFFHHLPDEQAVAALVEMLRVSRRGGISTWIPIVPRPGCVRSNGTRMMPHRAWGTCRHFFRCSVGGADEVR